MQSTFKTDVLFINKRRENYGESLSVWNPNTTKTSSGLTNSVSMLVSMLQTFGVNAVLEEVIDNNCIDRIVTQYKPKFVVIEALWVVPEKFEILHRLHPDVRWVIRLHSEVPFISNEGIAFKWLNAYSKLYPVVTISANSDRMQKALKELYDAPILHLPNYYVCSHNYASVAKKVPGVLNISCFGAIRPLKNHLMQAIAAIHYCDKNKLQLRFHINASRVEGNAESSLKNLRELFSDTSHELVEHFWLEHDDFTDLIRDEIELGMQVSFSESYNIVAADHVDCGVPVVTSPEVRFVASPFTANPTSLDEIECAISNALLGKRLYLHRINNFYLRKTNSEATNKWLKFSES
jgi:hypothetical protein